jgi:hypothetical protein
MAADNIENEMLPHYKPILSSSCVNESTPNGITEYMAKRSHPNLQESPKEKKNYT